MGSSNFVLDHYKLLVTLREVCHASQVELNTYILSCTDNAHPLLAVTAIITTLLSSVFLAITSTTSHCLYTIHQSVSPSVSQSVVVDCGCPVLTLQTSLAEADDNVVECHPRRRTAVDSSLLIFEKIRPSQLPANQ